jgi:uncharacterized protein
MYLIDTNIILELCLDQEKSDEVESFLNRISLDKIFLSEFSLNSIGIILVKRKQYDVFSFLLADLKNAGIGLIRLDLNEIENIRNISQKFNLDYDDSYQYVISEKYNLEIISYDKDFDKTDKKRKTPKDISK